MEWPAEDRVALQRAKTLLERPGLAVGIANTVGAPVEQLMTVLPDGAADMIKRATTKSLHAAVRVAASTMDDRRRVAADRLHKAAVAATGALGGAFGLATLAAELPVSTTIMMRSIADIARSEGHSIRLPRVQVACVEVFALGGQARSDDAAESALRPRAVRGPTA